MCGLSGIVRMAAQFANAMNPVCRMPLPRPHANSLYNLRATPRFLHELLALEPSPPFVDRHAGASQEEQDRQVPERKSLGLEDGLEEGDIDKGELDEERDRDGEQEHLVRRAREERHVQPTVLQRRRQVEENERGEGLRAVRAIQLVNRSRIGSGRGRPCPTRRTIV